MSTKTEEKLARVTLVVENTVMNDIKFISVWEKKKQKDLLHEVLTSFISDWKAKNKGVKFPL